jgi:hypothetical protein
LSQPAVLQPLFKKTITLGTGLKTADEFRKAFKKAKCHVGPWGNQILGQCAFSAATEQINIHLVVISGVNLGLEYDPTTKDVYIQARSFGLNLCPAEVGPQLRLQYPDQPSGERLLIAMEPIIDSEGHRSIFTVGRSKTFLSDERWLRASYGHPFYLRRSSDLFVFSLPQ